MSLRAPISMSLIAETTEPGINPVTVSLVMHIGSRQVTAWEGDFTVSYPASDPDFDIEAAAIERAIPMLEGILNPKATLSPTPKATLT